MRLELEDSEVTGLVKFEVPAGHTEGRVEVLFD